MQNITKSTTQNAIEILAKLVSFETLSGQSNLAFIDHVKALLQSHGVQSHLSFDETGKRANIHALVGPQVDGGVVLNGHSDVVPVKGQSWSNDPFKLVESQQKLYGRGAVDMKGFLACKLAMIPIWQQKNLQKPIHISICYDEEIGGFGAPILVENMARTAPKPKIAIIGEPTGMQIITGHKGAYEMQTQISGFEAHASNPEKGVSSIAYAARFIAYLLELAETLKNNPDQESPYDPPYATINIGTISGGAARNIIPGSCVFDWELRPMPGKDGDKLMAKIENYATNTLLAEMKKQSPNADIKSVLEARVPGLDHKGADAAVALVSKITGLNSTDVVSFGTDAGHFCNADISTIVFGPGSIDQAHKPDEFIEISQITACLKFLDNLGNTLASHNGPV